MKLRYTGHPLVDVGLATILAFNGKTDPAQLTEVDLASIADYLRRQYSKNPLRAYLTAIFPNSGFTQPAFDKAPAKREQYADKVLLGYRPSTPTIDDTCVFFGTAAVMRAVREQIPLISAQDVFNFFPEGRSGLPVSGEALLCIQAFPLGCLKCSGRVLLFHTSAVDLLLALTRRSLERNLRYLALAEQRDEAIKYADAKHARTQLVTGLLEVNQAREENDQSVSVTAYHLSNFGNNAAISIHHLPLQIMGFLQAAHGARYRSAWQEITQQGWEKAKEVADELELPARRNVLYEDLFDLPRDAARFLRTYFLRRPRHSQLHKTDPRSGYSPATEARLVNWDLTDLFLRKVIGMEKTRIDMIRQVGERLAAYIQGENDRRLFHRLFRAQRYDHVRAALIQASSRAVRQGDGLLITFDEFVKIFEEGDDLAHVDWKLARDLVLIRVIGELHRRDWFAGQPEVLEITDDALLDVDVV